MLNVVTLNDKYIRNIIEESNQLFEKLHLNKDIIPVALDIIIKYIKNSIPSEPREKEILYLAAYFISIRHPFSYPSSVTRENFSAQFNIKMTSLDYYVNKILSDLDFIRIHDPQMKPYFIDRSSLIFTVTNTITHSTLSESLINAIVNKKIPEVNTIVDVIVSVLLDRLKILPEVFGGSLRNMVMEMIREEVQSLKI